MGSPTSDTTAPTLPNWLPYACLVVMAMGYFALAGLMDAGPDTLWRLHIAGAIVEGQLLYRDIIEVNPPLWFWAAIPASVLGGYKALLAINFVLALITLWLAYQVAQIAATKSMAWAVVLGLGAGLFLVNLGEVGQREQAFLVACVLWSALLSARAQAKPVPLSLILAITVISAYGFALKHYFVLVPIVGEIVLLCYLKRRYRPLRVETLGLGGLAVAYGAVVLVFSPDFLGRILDLVQASYFGFGPLSDLGPWERFTALWPRVSFVLLPLVIWYLVRERHSLLVFVMVALVVAVFVILLQEKGWRYHMIAANGLTLVALGLLWVSAWGQGSKARAFVLMPAAIAAICGAAIAIPAQGSISSNGHFLEPDLANIIAATPKEHHIAIVSSAPDYAYFPLARAQRPHWSRHFSMWMMPGLAMPQTDRVKEAERIKQRNLVLNEFRADLTCTPPDLIIGEVGVLLRLTNARFDTMAMLLEDPIFTDWFNTHYRAMPDLGKFPIWRLRTPKPAPLNCDFRVGS